MRPILFVLLILGLLTCAVGQELPQPVPPMLWSTGTADLTPQQLATVEMAPEPHPTWSWWEILENAVIEMVWELPIP